MKKIEYSRTACPPAPVGYNHGESVEWRISYELTGIPNKRNNRPGYSGGDVGGWQVKSPKASLTDNDNCQGYLFGVDGLPYYYRMSREEFFKFSAVFSFEDKDSKSGQSKRRLKNWSSKMMRWLDERTARTP